MKYWFGFRCVDLDGRNPGSKILEGPFKSYDEAKAKKLALKAIDTESTLVFTAIDEPQARELMNTESFNKL
ncbi:hypothetical protein [Pseudoalteromonas sp. NJ631]|uniref:hypothetical protein n=1 Tax=Pseudoalteromonas sp. NJ631 TaxID=493915 RepID=UPI0003083E63|nr:hypothetical protein [Pseudoalteromonas sp. NJ631]